MMILEKVYEPSQWLIAGLISNGRASSSYAVARAGLMPQRAASLAGQIGNRRSNDRHYEATAP